MRTSFLPLYSRVHLFVGIQVDSQFCIRLICSKLVFLHPVDCRFQQVWKVQQKKLIRNKTLFILFFCIIRGSLSLVDSTNHSIQLAFSSHIVATKSEQRRWINLNDLNVVVVAQVRLEKANTSFRNYDQLTNCNAPPLLALSVWSQKYPLSKFLVWLHSNCWWKGNLKNLIRARHGSRPVVLGSVCYSWNFNSTSIYCFKTMSLNLNCSRGYWCSNDSVS